ncbi:hypothetical protein QL285_062244 [Trifolium repens]|nr:hypothetical protein QL285_062244 [Trifolium repens]
MVVVRRGRSCPSALRVRRRIFLLLRFRHGSDSRSGFFRFGFDAGGCLQGEKVEGCCSVEVFLPEVSLAPSKVAAPAVKGGVAAAVVMEVMRTVTGLIWSCPGAPERVGYVDTPC